MRKLYLILFSCAFASAIAQNDTLQPNEPEQKSRTKNFRFNNNIRSFILLPNGVGDNYIAKGNNGQFGLGMKLNFIELYNFHVGNGYEFLQYDVTDGSLGGNMSKTILNNLYLEVMYKVPLSGKITLFPKISGGFTVLHYTGPGRYGSQTGPRFSAGTYADYKISHWFEVFVGVDYSYTQMDINTHPDYVSFFSDMQQVNFCTGLKFNLKR